MANIITGIWSLDANARRNLFKGIAWTFLFKIFDVIPDIMIALMINLAIFKKQSFLSRVGFSSGLSTIYFLLGIILFAFVINSFCHFFGTLAFKRAARIIHYRLMINLSHHRSSQKSMNDAANEIQIHKIHQIEAVDKFISRSLQQVFRIIFSSMIIGAILLAIGVKFLCYVIFPLLPTFLFIGFLQRKIIPPTDQKFRFELMEMISRSNVTDFGIEDRVLFGIASSYHELQNDRDHTTYLQSALFPIARFSIQIGFLAILMHGIFMVLYGQVTVGAFFATIFLSRKFLQPFTLFYGLLNDCRRGIKALVNLTTN
jgi:ABC-type multidrug transport system fused ATPase/permease subunit